MLNAQKGNTGKIIKHLQKAQLLDSLLIKMSSYSYLSKVNLCFSSSLYNILYIILYYQAQFKSSNNSPTIYSSKKRSLLYSVTTTSSQNSPTLRSFKNSSIVVCNSCTSSSSFSLEIFEIWKRY